MKKNLLYYLHFLVPIFMITIPLFPISYLKYAIIFPTILHLIWTIFNGCPWTKLHATNDDEHFILDIARNFFPTLSRRQCNSLIGLTLNLIMLVSYYKLLFYCQNS